LLVRIHLHQTRNGLPSLQFFLLLLKPSLVDLFRVEVVVLNCVLLHRKNKVSQVAFEISPNFDCVKQLDDESFNLNFVQMGANAQKPRK
jgi:hypothetical protein